MTPTVIPNCLCRHAGFRHSRESGPCMARQCGCVRYKPPAPDFTADELATLHRIENTRPAPESYRDDEVCGVRAPSSYDGYCPCAKKTGHEPPHRCAHGAEYAPRIPARFDERYDPSPEPIDRSIS